MKFVWLKPEEKTHLQQNKDWWIVPAIILFGALALPLISKPAFYVFGFTLGFYIWYRFFRRVYRAIRRNRRQGA